MCDAYFQFLSFAKNDERDKNINDFFLATTLSRREIERRGGNVWRRGRGGKNAGAQFLDVSSNDFRPTRAHVKLLVADRIYLSFGWRKERTANAYADTAARADALEKSKEVP